jgi:DNA-binding protein
VPKKPVEKKPVEKKQAPKPKPAEKKPETAAPKPKPVERKPEAKSTEAKPTEAKPVAAPREDNTVFIGKKPVMNYVIACLTLFNAGGKEVTVKARGLAISRAVDTIELLRRAFVKDVGVADICLGTEEVTREEGRKSNVSTIEITVAKSK